MRARRFQPSLSVKETEACFIVRDRNGQALAYVYFEDELGRRAAAKLLTRDEARRVAANIAKLPEPTSVLRRNHVKNAPGDRALCRMGGVVSFERSVASLAVVTKLVELGYLQPGARHRATAIARAIDRLRGDLVRDGVIRGRDLLSSAKDEDHGAGLVDSSMKGPTHRAAAPE